MMDPRNPVNGQTPSPICNWPACLDAKGSCRNEPHTPCDRRMVGASPTHITGEGLRKQQTAREAGKLFSTWPARILIVALVLIALGTFAAQALEELAELDRRIELAGRV